MRPSPAAVTVRPKTNVPRDQALEPDARFSGAVGSKVIDDVLRKVAAPTV